MSEGPRHTKCEHSSECLGTEILIPISTKNAIVIWKYDEAPKQFVDLYKKQPVSVTFKTPIYVASIPQSIDKREDADRMLAGLDIIHISEYLGGYVIYYV